MGPWRNHLKWHEVGPGRSFSYLSLGWFGTDFKTFFGFFLDLYSPFWGQEGFENDPEP